MGAIKVFLVLIVACLFEQQEQGLEGVYLVDYSGEPLFLMFEKKEEKIILKYLVDKKESGLVVGVPEDQAIYFEGVSIGRRSFSLKVSLSDPNLLILLKDGKSNLLKMNKLSSRIDLDLSKIPKYLNNGLDIDLIGDWTMLYMLNPDGIAHDWEAAGKGYMVRFSESGAWVLDSRVIRDQLNAGGAGRFSYQDIPSASWRVSSGQLEVNFKSPVNTTLSNGSNLSYYLIRNDTLYTTSPQGYTTVHLRK
jgi:hypothetical protein